MPVLEHPERAVRLYADMLGGNGDGGDGGDGDGGDGDGGDGGGGDDS
jgi:hypothetical protein